MSDDDWTPARGYRLAAYHLVVRSGIIAGASLLAGAGFVKACEAMGFQFVHWSLPATAGAALGIIEGYVFSWHVTDKCGLSGRSLLVPALVLPGLAQFLAYQATTAIHPLWEDVLIYLFLPAFGLSILLAFKNFLMES